MRSADICEWMKFSQLVISIVIEAYKNALSA